MKKKYLIMLFLLFFFITNNAYSNNLNLPSISFSRVLEKQIPVKIDETTSKEVARFFRMLGSSQSKILSSNIESIHATASEDPFSNTFSKLSKGFNSLIFTFEDIHTRNLSNPIYLFNNNKDESIGYCLLDPLVINDFFNDPIINQIKSLKVSQDYLKKQIKLPTNSTKVTFYEKDNGSFIERYCIVKTAIVEVLVLDAFYPKDLEYELQPYIVENINKNLIYLPNEDRN